MSYLIISPQYFVCIPLPLLTLTIVNLSHLLIGHLCIPSSQSESSQSHLPNLVHYGDHSYLIRNIIHNPISPSMPRHSSQHPHFRYFHLFGRASKCIKKLHNSLLTYPDDRFTPKRQHNVHHWKSAKCDVSFHLVVSADFCLSEFYVR